MDQISFSDVTKLVNRIGGTSIQEVGGRTLQDQYAWYEGSIESAGFRFTFRVLYLFANATKEGTRSARVELSKLVAKGERVRVVYAPSANKGLIDHFTSIVSECTSLSEYFLSFIRQQTENYLAKIKNLSLLNYVDPHVTTPSGFDRKIPNPVGSFLFDVQYSERKSDGELAVVLAEPGQGKTYMSKFLATTLANRGLIPIYVHSEQWAKMQVDDLSSIWKTVVHSFRHFESPLTWIDGAEKEFLKVALRLGLFRLIFDGFDEFILWNRGKVDASETLTELQSMAEMSGARLLLTARTSFWDSEIQSRGGVEQSVPLHLYTIKPFDQNQAKAYFERRFPGRANFVKAASNLFGLLQQENDDKDSFVGRGFFLSLIADLVARGFTDRSLRLDGRTKIQWVMEAFCTREQVRQKLPLTAKEQLLVFREFAEMVASGESRGTDTLKMVLSVVARLQDDQIEELVKIPAKLKDHPLIRFERGEWNFTQDQIEYALLAERLVELSGTEGDRERLQGLLRRAEFTASLQFEVASALVQQVFETRTTDDAFEKCREIVEALTKNTLFSVDFEAYKNSHSFSATLALIAVGQSYGKGSDRAEKTKTLLSLLPKGQLSDLCFSGTIASFDFRDVKFSNCRFEQVTFANCRFSHETAFRGCRFIDLRLINCEQAGEIDWAESNIFDRVSQNLVEAEQVNANRRSYGEANLRGDIDYLVRRFLPKEHGGFKKIEDVNLHRGLIAHSKHRIEIIEGLKRHCLDVHNLSGPHSKGYSVTDEARPDFLFYVSNGVFTGRLAEYFDELKSRLVLA